MDQIGRLFICAPLLGRPSGAACQVAPKSIKRRTDLINSLCAELCNRFDGGLAGARLVCHVRSHPEPGARLLGPEQVAVAVVVAHPCYVWAHSLALI